MTEFLYQTDAYLKEFHARVTGTDPERSALILDRSAFFPGGGGQPADTGRIECEGVHIRVVKFAREGKEILHIVDGPLPKAGSEIRGEIRRELPISVRILPREEAEQIPDLIRTKINLLPPDLTEIRVVEIEGLDIQADGGTHVENTREIGTFRITGHKSKGRINKRLQVELDDNL